MSNVALYQSGPSVFKKLVRLVARAFYSGSCPPKQEGPGRRKWERIDTRGLAIVILDTLTQQEWVKEENLAKELRIAPKLLLKALRYLEQERILRHESRKEGKRAKAKDIVVAATRKEELEGEETQEEVPTKPLLQSYWAIDYPVFWNTLRLRFHLMRFKIKSEVEDSNSVMDYLCPKCGNRYTSLDFSTLLNRETGQMICEDCGTEVLEQLGGEGGTGKTEDRRQRREDMKAMLRKMDEELKPITDVMNQAKDVNPPDYGCLADWAYEESLKKKAKQDEIALGEQVEGLTGWDPSFDLDLNGNQTNEEKNKEVKKEKEGKVHPPWMLKTPNPEVASTNKMEREPAKRKAESLVDSLDHQTSKKSKSLLKIEIPASLPIASSPHRRLHPQQFSQAKKKIKIISTSPTLGDLEKAQADQKKTQDEDDIEWEDAGAPDSLNLNNPSTDLEWEDVAFDEEAARLADLESDIHKSSGWTTLKE